MRLGPRAVCSAVALLVLAVAGSAAAADPPAPTGADLGDEVLGLTLRGTGGAFAGSNAEHVAEPELGFGASVHAHLTGGLYLDLSYDQRIPALAVSSNGTMFSLGVGQETAGLRERLPLSATSNLVLGAGAGAGTLHHLEHSRAPIFGAAVLYGTFGWERQVSENRERGSSGYVGVEAVWNHYVVSPNVGFQGGLGELRATFTYYFGSGDLKDCR